VVALLGVVERAPNLTIQRHSGTQTTTARRRSLPPPTWEGGKPSHKPPDRTASWAFTSRLRKRAGIGGESGWFCARGAPLRDG